jgi:teichuronic acid biosynthesis glycosyltransferase TuaH
MRIVLTTSDDAEHHYVANRLDAAVDLGAIIVDRGRKESPRERFRHLRKKYTPPQLVSRVLLRLMFIVAGDERRRRAELPGVLGDEATAFQRPDIVDYVAGINTDKRRAVVRRAARDRLLVYSTEIVGKRVLAMAGTRAENLHVGLSPEYRGSDCAFWPLYNRQFGKFGATVHECTSKIAGGEIYAQAAATLEPDDGLFAIFRRSVKVGAQLYVNTVRRAVAGELPGNAQDLSQGREYRSTDMRFHRNVSVRWMLATGMLRRHLLGAPMRSAEPSRRQGPWPTVSVTIVNHRARRQLRECLSSLRRHPYTHGEMEVVVLDNASDDGSIEMMRDEFAEVMVIAERRRRGFGANQNRAVAASRGDVVVVLNPDATVRECTLDLLVEALMDDEAVAVAGGSIVNSDGSPRQDRPYPFPRPWSALAKAVGLRRFARAGSWSRRRVLCNGWFSGAAFAVTREAFRGVGGFDEAFFMYSEDVDFFKRIVETGRLLAWVPDAVVEHPFPDESAEASKRRETEVVRAELRYMHKHFGRRGAIAYRCGILADAGSRAILFSLPGFSRLGRTHGMGACYSRRAHAARFSAALRSRQHEGLAELADKWNRQHAAEAVEAGRRQSQRLVLFDSSTSWDGPWMAFQHIAIHLAERAPVLFIDAPESPVGAYRSRREVFLRSRLRQVRPNLHVLTPAAPPGLTRALMHRVTAWAVKRSVRKAVRSLGGHVGATMASLSHVNIFGIGEPRIRMYYVSDDFEAGARLMGRPPKRLAALDRELAEQADVIVTVSAALSERYESLGFKPVLIPNGVEVEAFAEVDRAPPPGDVELAAPIAGFIGQIGDRIDFEILEAVADSGISVLLVGPRQLTFTQDARLGRLLKRGNVQWVGPKDFAELPSYLRVMDVGMVPYVDSDFNRASFPLKTLEYLAAGRAVVATPLPAVLWLNTDLISVGHDPAEFAAAVVAAARAPGTEAELARRRALASQHSWARRTEQIIELLHLDS